MKENWPQVDIRFMAGRVYTDAKIADADAHHIITTFSTSKQKGVAGVGAEMENLFDEHEGQMTAFEIVDRFWHVMAIVAGLSIDTPRPVDDFTAGS